jgi:ABC-type Fe3+-hydroxamate transport system substrate-binding protein
MSIRKSVLPIVTIAVLLAVLLALLAYHFSGNSSPGSKATDIGSEAARPLRVVSLSLSGTRALVKLGLARLIVATDSESRQLLRTGLGYEVPETAASQALDYAPNLVLVGTRTAADTGLVRRIESSGAIVLKTAPHDLADGLALYHELGIIFGVPKLGRDVSHQIGDPIATIAVKQLGRARPRVAVVIGQAPLTLAAGHGFESELVENVGGDSVTHGSEEPRVLTDVAALQVLKPDLVVVASSKPLGEVQRAAAAQRLAPLIPQFATLDCEALWLGEGLATVKHWERLVAEARDLRGR